MRLASARASRWFPDRERRPRPAPDALRGHPSVRHVHSFVEGGLRQPKGGGPPAESVGEARVRWYLSFCELAPRSVGVALRAIAEAPPGAATLVHCTAGKDRTGVVCALALAAAGAEHAAICSDFAATGDVRAAFYASGVADRDEPRLRAMAADGPELGAPSAADMAEFLSRFVRAHGSVDAWCVGRAGLDARTLDALRARLSRPAQRATSRL